MLLHCSDNDLLLLSCIFNESIREPSCEVSRGREQAWSRSPARSQPHRKILIVTLYMHCLYYDRSVPSRRDNDPSCLVVGRHLEHGRLDLVCLETHCRDASHHHIKSYGASVSKALVDGTGDWNASRSGNSTSITVYPGFVLVICL